MVHTEQNLGLTSFGVPLTRNDSPQVKTVNF